MLNFVLKYIGGAIHVEMEAPVWAVGLGGFAFVGVSYILIDTLVRLTTYGGM